MPVTLQEWAASKARAAVEVERVRRDELQAFDPARDWRMVDALLDLGARFAVPRPTSGLVEQQRLFRKLAS